MSKNNFSAINIGPIISTLGMARKPRELWAASFLFSHLMKCLYAEAEAANGEIISPAKPEMDKNKVGIYPDRIYVKGDFDIKNLIRNAVLTFYSDLYGTGGRSSNNPDLNYFNLMSANCDTEKESDAIAELNQKLDVLELCNYASDGDAAQTIYNIISKKPFSSLFELAINDEKFPIPDLETIAKRQIIEHPEMKMKSHHKYFCVVQADGDNVGKTVSHKDLKDGEILKISKELVSFGIEASKQIEAFGGLPIYAGGDDLLFIAPVIGKDGSHIFNLIESIENGAFKGVHDVVGYLGLKDNDGNKIEASLSFGVSISYYKYPLYEALESARNLLFGKAKNIKQKKALAWSLRKHSGGTFDATFSLKNEEIRKQFSELINATTDNDTVSAVAHKIRQEDSLVNIVLASNNVDRLDALFEKILEFDSDKTVYFDAIKNIMPTLYKLCEEENKARKEKNEPEINYIQALYSLLRTAKFIKGEDMHDE